jgi:hypothetical protein
MINRLPFYVMIFFIKAVLYLISESFLLSEFLLKSAQNTLHCLGEVCSPFS